MKYINYIIWEAFFILNYLISNVNNIFLSTMNLLLLQCKVLDRLNDFFQIFEERLYGIFSHIEFVSCQEMWSKTFFFVRIDLSFLLKYYTRDEISIKTVIEEGIHQWHGNMWLIISQFGCNNRVCPCAEWVARGRRCWAIHHDFNISNQYT